MDTGHLRGACAWGDERIGNRQSAIMTGNISEIMIGNISDDLFSRGGSGVGLPLAALVRARRSAGRGRK
jgi:hypothetical protein